MRIHRFQNGVCRKCGTKEAFIRDMMAFHGGKFVQQITHLVEEHPEKKDDLMEKALQTFPCTMTDDELIIKDIIE